MKIIDSGTLRLAPGEFVTVSIQKTVGPYMASVSLLGASWAVSPEPPLGLTGRGAFIGPPAGGSVSLTLLFDFVPDASGAFVSGDRYDVVIQGVPNEEVRLMNVFAGGLQSRSLTFLA